jgi:tRNA A37 threonylcarbamoyladenosine synthetase subunit TsaC/SUA5/YrdC
LKGRDYNKPLALLISNRSEEYELVLNALEANSEDLIHEFKQGGVTVVLRPDQLPDLALRVGEIQPGPIAVRCPNHKILQMVLWDGGYPFACWATSVNRSGMPPATTSDEVLDWIDSLEELSIDPPSFVFLSRQPCTGKPSSVIDLTGDEPVRLR